MLTLFLRIASPLVALISSPPAQWRLRYIDLQITIDPARHQVSGVSRLTFTPANRAAADLIVDLADSMTVDSARVVEPLAGAVVGIREPGTVRFPLAKPADSSYRVAIWYHGTPVRNAVGFGEHAGVPRGASFGIPRSARQWWPSADEPDQKADSADIRLTAPASLTVASNGRLVDRIVSPDGRTATAHWSVRHPIYSDVVSFALADYAVTRESITLADGRRMPLEFYVFPEDSAKAAVDFAAVAQIIPFLESALGRYPFGDEKYALAEFARPSFREGQTITNLGASHITGRRDMEQIISHEVAHQWFGNSLSVKRWEDMWLNESLSEFMAWQWTRKTQGDSAYQALFDQSAAAEYTAPIAPADPTNFGSLFGLGTFAKGPVVLSMLRDVMGDAPFAAALRNYVKDHSYGSVEGADFERAAERAYHKPLGWFFDQWIREAVIPSVSLSWEPAGTTGITVRLQQTHAGKPFQLPLDVLLTRPDGTGSTHRLWINTADQRITIPNVGEVRNVSIDHRRQLVKVVP